MKEIIKEKYGFFVPKKMYSLRIDKEIIDKTKKEAKKLSISTAAFIRQAILEKINNQDKIKDIEKRLEKLEKGKII
jgi:predicted DNA-binding protein